MAEKRISAGTGISRKDDPFAAGKEAVQIALSRMGSEIPDFGIVFCSARYALDKDSISKLAKGAQEAFHKSNPDIRWVGATTAGELSDHGFSNDSCVAMAIRSENMHFGVGIAGKFSKDAYDAGKKAVTKAMENVKRDQYVDPYIQFLASQKKKMAELLKVHPYLFMMLSPGCTKAYNPDYEKALAGVLSKTGPVPLIGGCAADDSMLEQTYVMCNGEVYDDTVIIVSICSNLMVKACLGHGYRKAGKILLVTRAKGNVAYELNGTKAASEYARVLGITTDDLEKDLAKFASENPLGVADNEGWLWLYSPVAVTKGALVFREDVEGKAFSLMSGKKKDLSKASEDAVSCSAEDFDSIGAMFAFSDAARLPLADEEFKILKRSAVPFIGFYSYGVQGMAPSGALGHHDCTFACLSVSNSLINE